MNERLLIRVAAMRRASDIGRDHGANKWRLECLPMTSIQQNEKQHSESPHTTQAFIVGFWGVRYQVKAVFP